MAAGDHLNRTLFHGTVRPGWDPTSFGEDGWFHAGGDLESATRRLSATARPGGIEETEWEDDEEKDEFGRPDIRRASTHGDPRVFSIRLRPDVRMANKQAAKPYKMADGTYQHRDLGHREQEGWDLDRLEELKKTHDVIPYENLDEGGTGYLVRGSAVESFRSIKRYGRGIDRFKNPKGLPWREGS